MLLQTIALGVALGIPATILSAGNGLRAVDVIALMHRSLTARALLWTGWLILAGPALLRVFVGPGATTLRALRLPRVHLLGSLFMLGTLTQLPWAIFFLRGAGLLGGFAALTWAVALGAAVIAAPRRPPWFAALALGAAFIACDPALVIWACCGSVLAPFALHAAWRSAPERRASSFRWTRPSQRLVALYVNHLLRLARAERSRLTMALVTSATGCAGMILSLRNDPSERPVQRALTVMALPLTVAAALCITPLLENERQLRTLLRSLRVPRSIVLSAFFLGVATPSSALAATSGVVTGAMAHLPMSGLSSALVAWASCLSCVVAIWGRLLERRARRTAGTFVAGATLIAALATVGAYSW